MREMNENSTLEIDLKKDYASFIIDKNDKNIVNILFMKEIKVKSKTLI